MSALHGGTIAIVGGGPGGLTLARLLQMRGANVKVYERDAGPNARVQGATLDLHQDSGLRAIEEAEFTEAFMANYRPGADRLIITDKHGEVQLNEFANDHRPEIDRGPLRKILLDSLEPETVVWDSQFKALDYVGDTLRLEFANGTTAFAQLVVAADGANSKVRPYVTAIAPEYSGITMLEGYVGSATDSTPIVRKLMGTGKVCALGDGKALMFGCKGDGSLLFYASVRVAEDWSVNGGIDFSDKAQVLNWFKKEYAGWADLWDELFLAAESFLPRPQYAMPMAEAWEPLPNLTMLGDAAHVMPPFSGEGVNMAMQDALELAESLVATTDAASAVADYEKRMRTRAADAIQGALRNTEMFHSPDGLARLVAFFTAHQSAGEQGQS